MGKDNVNFFEKQGIGILDYFCVQTHTLKEGENIKDFPSKTMFVTQIEFVPSLNEYAMKLRELTGENSSDWIVSQSFFKNNIHMFTKIETY